MLQQTDFKALNGLNGSFVNALITFMHHTFIEMVQIWHPSQSLKEQVTTFRIISSLSLFI